MNAGMATLSILLLIAIGYSDWEVGIAEAVERTAEAGDEEGGGGGSELETSTTASDRLSVECDLDKVV